jgi:tRNA(Arg) A34 adenosine deaminase TadA
MAATGPDAIEARERHLRRAIELAGKGRAARDMPFGWPLVGSDGDVLAEDRNTVTRNGITAHPELKTALWAWRNLACATAAAVSYEGPSLYDETRVPLDGHYDER